MTNLVSPIIIALGKPGWVVDYKSGSVIIANPGALTTPEECVVSENSLVSWL